MSNFIYFLAECPTDVNILQTIRFIITIIKIVFVITPLILIVLITMDVAKIAISGEAEVKNAISKSKNRIIATIAMFFVVPITSVIVHFINNYDFPYANYIVCANQSDIEAVAIANAEDAIASVKLDMSRDKLADAYAAVAKIKDEETKNRYIEEVNVIKEEIIAQENSSSNQNSGSSSGSLTVNYSDAIVENLGAFIGSEAGWLEDGFLGQLMTGAVYINNYYAIVGNKTITKDTMCQLFSYQNVYASFYCDYNYNTLASRGIDEKGKKQLTAVAKILLSKKFTIPKDVRYEAADYIITADGGEIWGKTYTGSQAFPYVYFGCSKYDKPIDNVDVYGNSVSSDFSTYQQKADTLFKQYVK